MKVSKEILSGYPSEEAKEIWQLVLSSEEEPELLAPVDLLNSDNPCHEQALMAKQVINMLPSLEASQRPNKIAAALKNGIPHSTVASIFGVRIGDLQAIIEGRLNDNPRQKQLVELLMLGYNVTDTAEMMGVTTGYVYRKMNTYRKLLKQL